MISMDFSALSQNLQQNYDQLAAEYANQLYDELEKKPLDKELLELFAAKVASAGGGKVCDLGCGGAIFF